jgi:hypothetical protein
VDTARPAGTSGGYADESDAPVCGYAILYRGGLDHMAKPKCDRCGVRFAQHFVPLRLCRGCHTGRSIGRPESEDDPPSVIEAKYQRAMSHIHARRRAQVSQEANW